MACAALNSTALAESVQARAESLGYQCRAAVRAEIKGTDCRLWHPRTITDSCDMWPHSQIAWYDNKVLECAMRGGPERQAKS
jgi:hypothetical protein